MASRPLSKNQVHAILDLIRDTHLAFTVQIGGVDSVSKEDYARLARKGLIKKGPNLLKRAYQFGLLSGSQDVSSLSPQAFIAFLNSPQAKLSEKNKRVVAHAVEHIAQHVNGMALSLQRRFHSALMESERQLRRVTETVVAKVVEESVAKKTSARELAAKLKQATKDARKDWLLTAVTELHNLMEEGRAAAIVANHGGDPLVYKQPRFDACRYCKVLYLKPDGSPRVFRLSQLVSNGSNIGRKANRPSLQGANATQYKAVLGSVHPCCRCELRVVKNQMRKADSFELGLLTPMCEC